jgi:hypothetical protein
MPISDAPTRKIIEFDAETWQALDGLRRDSMKSIQELMDEAVRDLLRKHNRPTTLREMLQASARTTPANDAAPEAVKRAPKRNSKANRVRRSRKS